MPHFSGRFGRGHPGTSQKAVSVLPTFRPRRKRGAVPLLQKKSDHAVNNQAAEVVCQDIAFNKNNPDTWVVVYTGQIQTYVPLAKIDQLTIRNDLLFEVCPEQKNIVNILNLNGINETLTFSNEEGASSIQVKKNR